MDKATDGLTREWLSPNRDFGGIMTTHPDGSRSLELHQECRLQLCRENIRRIDEQKATK